MLLYTNRLKEKRIEKGLSQYELAKLTGVHVTTISKIENGQRLPSLKVAAKLAKVLDVSLDDLFDSTKV